jgi:hypothetical protein
VVDVTVVVVVGTLVDCGVGASVVGTLVALAGSLDVVVVETSPPSGASEVAGLAQDEATIRSTASKVRHRFVTTASIASSLHD